MEIILDMIIVTKKYEIVSFRGQPQKMKMNPKTRLISIESQPKKLLLWLGLPSVLLLLLLFM